MKEAQSRQSLAGGMDVERAPSLQSLASRRYFLGTAGAASLTLWPLTALADAMIKLPLPGGPDERSITTAFPQKGALILQRTRPPLLETPIEVFDQSVFTPNDRFYVRWHWSLIPSTVDVSSFRLAVRGHVNQNLSLSLDDLMALPRVELVAINQCSGNSRLFPAPRARRAVVARRHGKRALDRGQAEGRARSRRGQIRRRPGSL
jgi:DMSO/TMAO reductase YedYZ molybdopterin-dependent catalytic subunit